MTRIKKISQAVLFSLMVTVSPVWGVEVGEPVPDFSIRTFEGNYLTRTMLAGRPLLLVFWNTWCPDCMRELPKINRIAARFGPKEVAMLAINTGLNDSESKARAYWTKHGYALPAGFDHAFKVVQAFRVVGVPTIILVDFKGVVQYNNPQLPDDIEKRLRELARH
jgi:thiol-disulfide isomerase/thioredoxin